MLALMPLHGASATTSWFDIPAQSLNSALDAFCAVTGTEIYYDGAVARDLRSSTISGNLNPDEALRSLIAGTDLVALRARENSYLLIHPGDEGARALAAARIAEDGAYLRYFAVIQDDIQRLLCGYPYGSSGERLVIRIWIGPSGTVRRAELDGTVPQSGRWRPLIAALGTAQFHAPPPAQMPQPVSLVVLPATSHCPAALIGR
jgi:hypothetical protein